MNVGAVKGTVLLSAYRKIAGKVGFRIHATPRWPLRLLFFSILLSFGDGF
jgi:hypothetical protein